MTSLSCILIGYRFQRVNGTNLCDVNEIRSNMYESYLAKVLTST